VSEQRGATDRRVPRLGCDDVAADHPGAGDIAANADVVDELLAGLACSGQQLGLR
jgi:hypothetical protein